MTSIVLEEDIEEDILIILEGKSLLKFEVRNLTENSKSSTEQIKVPTRLSLA